MNKNLNKTKKMVLVILVLLVTAFGISLIFKKTDNIPTVLEKENVKIENKKDSSKSLEEKIKNNIKKSQENTKKQMEDSKKDGEITM